MFRILFVKNLRYVLTLPSSNTPGPVSSVCSTLQKVDLSRSYNVTAEELFDLFGKFGPIR